MIGHPNGHPSDADRSSDAPLSDLIRLFLSPAQNLAANKMYSNLDISIKKALEQRVDSNCELLVTCFAHTSLHNVIELFVSHEAHRLIIIDGSDKVVGIICLSDVLAFLITEHNEFSELNEEREEHDLVRECDRGTDLKRSVLSKTNVSDKVLQRINELSEQKRLIEERRPGENEKSGQSDKRKELGGRESNSGSSREREGRSAEPEGSKVLDKVKQFERRSSGEAGKERKMSSESREASKGSSLSREQSKESSQKSGSRGSRELSEEQSSENDLSREEPEESSGGSTEESPEESPQDKNGEEFTV